MSFFSVSFRRLAFGLLSLSSMGSMLHAAEPVPPEWAAAARQYDAEARRAEFAARDKAIREYRQQRAWEQRQRRRSGGGLSTHAAYQRAAMLWAATR